MVRRVALCVVLATPACGALGGGLDPVRDGEGNDPPSVGTQPPSDTPGSPPVDQPGDDPTEVTGDDPADDGGDDPTDDPADDPTDDPVDDPTGVDPATSNPPSCDPRWIADGDGGDERGTVRFLYCALLGREPDPGGLAFYADRLQRFLTSRAGLIRALLLSDEFSAQPGEPATRVYQRVFRREPDAGGLAYWQTRPLATMVDAFLESREFFESQPPELFGACSRARLQRLVDSGLDASVFLADECLAWAAPGAVITLPPGAYTLRKALWIDLARDQALSGRGVTLRSDGEGRCPYPPAGQCAELVGHDEQLGGTVLLTRAPKLTLDRLVINGDRERVYARFLESTNLPRASVIHAPTYGPFSSDGLTITRSVLRGAVSGTGMTVAGVTGMTFVDNLVTQNGWHWLAGGFGFWADGVTVHSAHGAVFRGNTFVDNTDIQLIFGACTDCEVSANTFRHSEAAHPPRQTAAGAASSTMDGAAWAELAIQSWPTTSGDYRGAHFYDNDIDCGATRRCGYGILIGNASWAGWGSLADPSRVRAFGARVHQNRVRNTVLGIEVDHASAPPPGVTTDAVVNATLLYANTVSASGGRFELCANSAPSCARLWTEAINVSPASRPYVRGEGGALALDFQHTSFTLDSMLPMAPERDVLAGATVMSLASQPNGGRTNFEDVTSEAGVATTNDDRVRLLYRLLLGRDVDPSGLGWHRAHLEGGASVTDCAWEIVTSPELRARHDLDALPVRDLVALMYQLAFTRAPDRDGLEFWSSWVAQAPRRWEFVRMMLSHEEFTRRF